MVDWSKTTQSAWYHSDVNFDSKSGILLLSFFWENHIWFWILGSQESNALNISQFGIETRKVWPIQVMLCKEYVVMGFHMGPIAFGCSGSFFGSFLRLFFSVEIGFFLGYFNFINPNIWLQGYFHNLDLIYF